MFMMKVKKVVSLGRRLFVELPSDWTERKEILPGDTVYVVENNDEVRIIPLPLQRKK
ncbi:MAG TPA: AbrB/MazE/SpoVT family DNA-binding domain-containing protein [Fervidicoccus fontis]|uniref:AbrB/MazE/SpoVT family DNA-binding domain-containing protein n=1 Tax=Fervidicoccus fontis TaxID=683846 RepID=A0A7C2YDQ0_9CREN|nr:AbrB/MazE/SpoVT family DNA-binding domain-containing protein [Fervidicoccus fontis]